MKSTEPDTIEATLVDAFGNLGVCQVTRLYPPSHSREGVAVGLVLAVAAAFGEGRGQKPAVIETEGFDIPLSDVHSIFADNLGAHGLESMTVNAADFQAALESLEDVHTRPFDTRIVKKILPDFMTPIRS